MTVVDLDIKNARNALHLTLMSVEPFYRDICHLVLVKNHESKIDSVSNYHFSFSESVRFLSVEINDSGIYDAFNFAIRNLPDDANVFFLNAGDLLVRSPNLLLLSQNVRKERKYWGYGQLLLVNDECKIKSYTFRNFNRILLNLGIKIVHQQATVYSVHGLRLIGGFKADHKIAADMFAHYQLAQICNPFVTSDCISIFALGGISAQSRSKHFSDWRSILKSQSRRHYLTQTILNPILVFISQIKNRWNSNNDYI